MKKKSIFKSCLIAFPLIIFTLYSHSFEADSSSEVLTFPENFKWCVATAAHQIEGGNENNDWWEWEHSVPSKIKNGENSGLAIDHWNKVAEDTKLLKDLGVKQYRFSIEWSRIEPKEGVFNLEAIHHYKDELKELQKYGIAPMVTLHHFTSPLWFAKMGGWSHPDSPQKFLQFVKFVNQQLGASVDQWITFNEPMVMIAAGYINGVFPPGIKDWKSVIGPIRNILIAHSLSYKELHRNKNAQVGIAHHLRIMHPYNKLNPIEWYLANKLSKAFNWTLLNALQTGTISLSVPTKIEYEEYLPQLKDTQDFIGVNYYSRDLVKFTPKGKDIITVVPNDKSPKSDLNWEIYPEGLYDILKSVSEKFENLPVFITENGIADKSDSRRADFLKQHLLQIHHALEEGINVLGYCHWTLIDNFEWAEGRGPRFGLYDVDYKTLKRTPRKSARYYQEIIERNGILVESKNNL
ncbi:MAG: glycoside hydrolase family 1 protein [Bacteriovorax sp.]